MVEGSTRATELLEEAERLLDERFVEEAWSSFLAAEGAGADPDRCSAGKWQVAMLRGDFEGAWEESDGVYSRGSQGADGLWSGEQIDGKRVVVRCLHGFGDAVQMVRYAPLLAARAAHVTWEVAPRLLPLMLCFRGVDDAITWADADPEWDVQVEVMELPYLFRTTLSDLPRAQKYLALPQEQLDFTSKQLGSRSRPRVGLVRTCGDWNPSRSVPLDKLRALSDMDVEIWSLESKSSLDRCAVLNGRDGRELTDGLVPLAATIANLDAVITPDTVAAHLAGAMGKPAFVMLQFAADWRWMTARTDTPWYPSLRLYRQPAPGDWASVVQSIRGDVERLVR
ncbi:MAG TPA: hypothetical protein VIG47_17955 [Gemmatimonadaceae bacterium]